MKSKNKKKYWIIGIVIVLSVLAIIFNIPSFSDWAPPSSLVGTWKGEAEVSVNTMTDGVSHGDGDIVPIEIHIAANGDVTGYIGEAELAHCTVVSNRSWLGRWLGIKTDYSIKKGDLIGKITQGDPQSQRKISIPFDLKVGKLVGSIQRIEGLKYPDSLFVRISLTKV